MHLPENSTIKLQKQKMMVTVGTENVKSPPSCCIKLRLLSQTNDVRMRALSVRMS